MPSRRARLAAAAAILAATLVAAACDDAAPASPVPLTPNASPVALLPTIYLLRPDQMAGYKRSNNKTLTPAIVAASDGDATLEKTLTDQGYTMGAQATYNPPAPHSGLPFAQVITQAAIFTDATGASRNDDTEKTRQDQLPAGGGTIATVTDLPATGLDALTVYVATSSDGTSSAQSFLAIMRRGRVVAELFAGGDPGTATEKNFAALLALQEQQLATNPS